LPSEHVEQIAAQKVYEQAEIPITTLGDRVSHIVQCCFNGRRVVIFSGGATQSDEIRAIQSGGGFGSIIGRNSFQRPKAEALTLLNQIMEIYQAEVPMRSPIMV
jgi:fructose-bisphosphate aldolase, class I